MGWSNTKRKKGDGMFDLARVCGVCGRSSGDSRIFGRRTWVAARGGNLAVRGKVSTVWMRKGWR